MPKTTAEWIILVIRLVVGGIFVYASIDKIFNPDQFAKIIHNYRILPPDLINVMAIVTPWFEFTAGVCMITGFKYRGASLIIAVMLAIFTVAMSSAYIRGLNINCGCFSTSSFSESDLLARAIEDILLLIGSIIILFKTSITRRFA